MGGRFERKGGVTVIHPIRQFALSSGTQEHTPMGGQKAIGSNPHLRLGVRFVEDALKHRIVLKAF